MNYTHLAGHLGADPETRFTPSGQKVTTLRVACRARKDETIWWKVTIWGEQFDRMLPYFKKGSAIMVSGELMKPEIFNDREGKPQISLQLVAHNVSFSPFGKPNGGKSEGGGPDVSYNSSFSQESSFGGQGQQGYDNDKTAILDEEIPF
ncbi:MAG: single-stranded DNA-binding protein [Verrucomicrobia bacterium]|nr:single-stranded DNA-binding protein [Verrucomicrobiota bacterium]